MPRLVNLAELSDHEIQNLANDVKDLVIDALDAKDHLDCSDSAEKLQRRYQLVIVRRGYFGRLYDKFFKTDDLDARNFQIRVVERIGSIDDEAA